MLCEIKAPQETKAKACSPTLQRSLTAVQAFHSVASGSI